MADRFSHDLMRTDNGPAISRLGTLTDSVQAICPPPHSNLQPLYSNVLCIVARQGDDNKEDETFQIDVRDIWGIARNKSGKWGAILLLTC